MTHTPALPVAQPAPPGLWVIHCDGSAIPNPGPMSLGVLLQLPDGSRHTLSQDLHRSGCNNEAELRALMAALQQAHALGARAIAVRSDSSLLIEQLRPLQPGQRPAAPIARLAELFDGARAWLARFDSVQWQWIPRHRNSAADTLARAALGAPAKVAPHPSHKKKKR